MMTILRAALRGRLQRRFLPAVLMVLTTTGAVAWAQTTCDDAIREAQKSYELGLFADVPGPTLEAGRPPRFAALVAQVRREEQPVQVTSVSKSAESLREAPATVVVI